MTNERLTENETSPNNYQNFPLKSFLWSIIILLSLIIGIFAHLSVGSWMESKLNQVLVTIPNCQITYQEFHFSWLPLPEIKLNRPRILGKCSPFGNRPLELSILSLQFRGPGIFPLGLKVKINIQFGRSSLDLFATLNPKHQVLAIRDGAINLTDLRKIVNVPVDLKGAALANALIEIENNKVVKGEYRLDLRALEIPAQTIQAIALPQLALEKGQMILTQNPKEIIVENLELGGANAPLRAEFKGKVSFISAMPLLSPLDLKGRVRFSPQLLQDFAIINLFTAGLKQDNGFYSVRIGGTLGKPSPKGL